MDAAKTAALEARFAGLHKPPEGEIAMQLDHPNIVQTYEYGVTTDGSPYLLMEYLDGIGVNQLLLRREEMLDEPGVKVRLIRQTAGALAYLHQVGFLHRDICPRNLIFLAGGSGDTNDVKNGGNVKLIDFGLSVPLTPPFMRPGNRTGTVNYMAPELIRNQEADVRVDVFSFGVSCYEILSGTLPWESATAASQAAQNNSNSQPAFGLQTAPPVAAAMHQAVMQRTTMPPRPLLEIAPQTPPRLATTIEWCIESDRDRRCPDMASFLKRITGV